MSAKFSDSRLPTYYAQIAKERMAPLWESLDNLVPRAPQPKAQAAHWVYSRIRDLVMQAGEVISAEQAIRRVLMLENPGLPGKASMTPNLYAGLQLILPGEIAPSHRHTQSAIRFVIEGQGAWTAVDGERTTMHPGDFIITPAWTWHDHGNPPAEQGGEPVVWLDGLDIPLVAAIDAGFAENYPETSQPLVRAEGDSYARFGHNLAPMRHRSATPSSPVFNYPYERTLETLDHLYRHSECDAWDGIKLRYVNPTSGGWPTPTLAAFAQFLPAGFNGRTYRSTDATVYCVFEGEGTAYVGEQAFPFMPHDIFVVPSWQPMRLESSADSVLFSYSDRPVMEALSLLREARD